MMNACSSSVPNVVSEKWTEVSRGTYGRDCCHGQARDGGEPQPLSHREQDEGRQDQEFNGLLREREGCDRDDNDEPDLQEPDEVVHWSPQASHLGQ